MLLIPRKASAPVRWLFFLPVFIKPPEREVCSQLSLAALREEHRFMKTPITAWQRELKSRGDWAARESLRGFRRGRHLPAFYQTSPKKALLDLVSSICDLGSTRLDARREFKKIIRVMLQQVIQGREIREANMLHRMDLTHKRLSITDMALYAQAEDLLVYRSFGHPVYFQAVYDEDTQLVEFTGYGAKAIRSYMVDACGSTGDRAQTGDGRWLRVVTLAEVLANVEIPEALL